MGVFGDEIAYIYYTDNGVKKGPIFVTGMNAKAANVDEVVKVLSSQNLPFNRRVLYEEVKKYNNNGKPLWVATLAQGNGRGGKRRTRRSTKKGMRLRRKRSRTMKR